MTSSTLHTERERDIVWGNLPTDDNPLVNIFWCRLVPNQCLMVSPLLQNKFPTFISYPCVSKREQTRRIWDMKPITVLDKVLGNQILGTGSHPTNPKLRWIDFEICCNTTELLSLQNGDELMMMPCVRTYVEQQTCLLSRRVYVLVVWPFARCTQFGSGGASKLPIK